MKRKPEDKYQNLKQFAAVLLLGLFFVLFQTVTTFAAREYGAVFEEEQSDFELREQIDSAASSDTISLYYLETWAQNYISMPSDYPSSYDLNPTNDPNLSFQRISGSSVTVDRQGHISLTPMYWYGNVGYSYKLEDREPDRIRYISGTSTIRISGGAESRTVTVTVVNYADSYAEEFINQWISENIRVEMTDYQKINEVCKLTAGYDYSPHFSSSTNMVISGGGDCWASTSLIMRICDKLGYETWTRNANLYAGSGHKNAMIYANGTYYEADAGYNEPAPRYYSLKERTELYSGFLNSSGEMTVYQYDGRETDRLEIPSQIDGKPVIAINTSFGARNSVYQYIEEIVIPDTVQTIGEFAFGSCSKLKKITIPSSVRNLDAGVFADCPALENISLAPDSPYLSFENGVIYDRNQTKVLTAPTVSTVTLASTVQTIGEYSFYYNSKLTSVDIPSAVTIEEGAFANCDNLVSVTLPSSGLETIGPFAFSDCASLPKIVLPASVTSINECAFQSCYNLSDITVLNPNVSLDMTELGTDATNVTIRGYRSSTAEQYAKDHDFTFVDLEELMKPTVTLTQDTQVLTAQVQSSVPYSGFGMVYANTSNPTLETSGRKRIAFTETTPNQTFSLTTGELNGVTVRAYVIYTDGKGNQSIIYSNPITVS